jgi:hypothetical protein
MNLVLAYRATDYVVFSEGRSFSVRVGEHSLLLDRLLARKKARSGAFITAWNPFSNRLGAGANACRDRELKRFLRARHFVYLKGEGRGQTADWPPEPSVVVLSVPRTQAASIGRRFRQNAIVYVTFGRPAELIMLRWLR